MAYPDDSRLFDLSPQHFDNTDTMNPPPDGGIQFQMPSFMYGGPPTLAPGGGAEVLSVGMLSDSSWFSNNGFTPRFSQESFFHPPSQQDQSTTDHQTPTSSSSAPFDFDSYTAPQAQPAPQSFPVGLFANEYSPTPRDILATAALTGLAAPSPLGLSVYSASGFDLLSILARVAIRPNPRIVLGPVDLTCSFVVVDVRRHDHPIVYCSPSFCRLTGYDENEILGRNCRFLQSPTGHIQRGEPRRFTSQEAVNYLKKSLAGDKECQTSIVNYRKNGQAFINLVTVIPISGGPSPGAPNEDTDIIYHVGFQVDLTEQPNAILEKLCDGTYLVNYSSQALFRSVTLPGVLRSGGTLVPSLSSPGALLNSRDKKAHPIPQVNISKELKKLLTNPSFARSIPITSSTTVPLPPPSASSSLDSSENAQASSVNNPLHLLLLEASPDFILVVSLKGSFLYVAPSVRRVLGYEPEEMVNKCIADFTHPEDVIPLMRELKESSATSTTAANSSTHADVGPPAQPQPAPRPVDLLFRAKTKADVYVWVECRGRLHVEPGKGRKAIILSGRAKEMSRLTWDAVALGGLTPAVNLPVFEKTDDDNKPQVEVCDKAVETEFWGTMGGECNEALTFTMIGNAVKDVLGWTPEELTGRSVATVVANVRALASEISNMSLRSSIQEQTKTVRSRWRQKDGGVVDVVVVLHMPLHDSLVRMSTKASESITPSAVIFQVKHVRHASAALSSPAELAHARSANIFEELETSRGSSWQYELQQLRFANQRLAEEIVALEAGAEKTSSVPGEAQPLCKSTLHSTSRSHSVTEDQSSSMRQPSMHSPFYTTAPTPPSTMWMAVPDPDIAQPSPSPDNFHTAMSEWSRPNPPSVSYQAAPSSSLKRSWQSLDSRPA